MSSFYLEQANSIVNSLGRVASALEKLTEAHAPPRVSDEANEIIRYRSAMLFLASRAQDFINCPNDCARQEALEGAITEAKIILE
jgi:hypothetical protein